MDAIDGLFKGLIKGALVGFLLGVLLLMVFIYSPGDKSHAIGLFLVPLFVVVPGACIGAIFGFSGGLGGTAAQRRTRFWRVLLGVILLLIAGNFWMERSYERDIAEQEVTMARFREEIAHPPRPNPKSRSKARPHPTATKRAR